MIEEKKQSRGLPFSSIVAMVLLLVVFFWFLSGDMYNFYASAVFLFYSWTNMMWVSVIMLGVFQTILLIPFRVIRLLDFKNIRDFQTETIETGETEEQQNFLKQQFKQGSWAFTLYLLDFVVQLTTYMTIGRLFLTDFYTKRLNPQVLYSFVPYPDYPIQDRFFKIPYPGVTKVMDFGMESVIYVWAIILIAELAISLIHSIVRTAKSAKTGDETKKPRSGGALSGKYLIVYGLILYALSYLLLRNFPVSWKIRIFTGDVAKQNNTFNTVTAIATFLTLMWFGVNDILKKGKIAREMGIPQRTIDTTQTKLFSEKLTSASLIGAAAYFITNQIPCAFELSIFTLEVISLFSPFTLDRLILKGAPPKKQQARAEEMEKEKQEVVKEFSGKMD